MGLGRIGVSAACALVLAATGWAQASPATAKTAGATFKNIHVLNDIPARELIPTMRYITVALGVRCSFCHVEGNFSQDTDHKRTARRMMEMVFAVNKNTFGGRHEISCYTCHRGASHPESIPALAADASKPAAPSAMAASASEPKATEIVSKYVAALGGADAIAAIHSLVETGSLATPRGTVQVEIDGMAPNSQLIVWRSPQGTRRVGYDGTMAWEQQGTGAARTESGPRARPELAPMPIFAAASLDAGAMRAIGSEKIGGRDTWRVIARRAGGGLELLNFDTQTGLLARVETFRRTPLGTLPMGTDYADYRDVAGVKVPFVVRQASAESSREYKFDSIRANTGVTAAQFQPPAGASSGQP